jgi:uncharacterized protein (TIGR04255 family)
MTESHLHSSCLLGRLRAFAQVSGLVADSCSIVCNVSTARGRKHPKLERPPLVSVICQARYTHVLALNSDEEQSDLLARLQGSLPDYPVFARVAQQTLLLSPEGIQPTEQKISSFQFSSADENWVVGISVDSVSLQTKSYEHFRDFQDRWRAVAEVVQEIHKPALQTRFGLRYTDELTAEGATTPAAWFGLLRSDFSGLGASDEWRDKVRQSFQEWVLELNEGLCTLRHGFLPTVFQGRDPFYLLDVDCYVEGGEPYDPQRQESLLDAFNDAAHALFVSSISPELYGSFGPEVEA